ncbi:MAG: hypothetical protein HC916_01685 [Coleofasciculaceae cyanobacterium SM2_1_6]|nr:hypothetical protein [Coleofasciculaceae cyanobacterium SM2_1_6]
MTIITPEFIQGVIRSGALAKARQRTQNGTAQPQNKARWYKFSTWTLICEEILDTEQPDDWYDDIIAELDRRGFSAEQVDKMRYFAWQTAGWLNYDRMVWDWCNLDETDMKTALAWQLRDGLINQQQYEEGLFSIEHYTL